MKLGFDRDFDTVIDRWQSQCEKYDTITQRGYPSDMIPMWVADMDFAVPDCVKKAMYETVDRGIFGYSLVGDRYFTAVENWFLRRYGWKVDRSWIVQTPGVVTALSAAIRVVTQPGDGVMIQSPVYHHFFHTVERNGRVVVENALKYENGEYTMDFADMEAKMAAAAAANAPVEEPEHEAEIGIDAFSAVELRVAEILACEPVPKAKKLLKLQVDLGYEKRQVVSGIAKFYQPADLIGKKVCLVTNLKPCKLCGVDSYGMILASGEEDVKVVFLDPTAKNGDRIH